MTSKIFFALHYIGNCYICGLILKHIENMINEVIKKNGITYGITLGVILALITATMYAIDLKLFVSNWIGPSIFVINLIVGIILLVKTKKDLNDSFSFKDAFTTYFITVLAALLISTLFSILLFNVIDPAAKETISEYLIKYMAEMLQKFGTPASSVNEALAKMRESNPFSTLEQLKGFVFSLALYSILGLILAAFFKSKTTQQEYK
ncbi:DUF4199 domain-containing protein [Flavobacterium granuli]|uniref:DUF4199 domain-containing protein n=1 Tax=Flavobacterium granuli TaxID=280093 RepID=A0ABU1S6G2_9FLAO|nr:DUF4199 domain-containing protein [Flavobacterium granuli]MDR6846573.1 hypothetical protein [Flavobacterium granuli]